MIAIAPFQPHAAVVDTVLDSPARLPSNDEWPLARLDDEIPLDVREMDGAYLVQAELPGVSRKDVRIHVDGSMLSLIVETTQGRHKGMRSLMHETHSGRRWRDLVLPAVVDRDHVKASLENGILSLTLPRRQSAKAHVIDIH